MPEKGRRRHGGEEAPGPEDLHVEGEESPVKDLEEAYADMRDRFWSMFELPEEFGTHLRAARREILLAVRSLIDSRVEALEEAEKRRESGRRTRVHIE